MAGRKSRVRNSGLVRERNAIHRRDKVILSNDKVSLRGQIEFIKVGVRLTVTPALQDISNVQSHRIVLGLCLDVMLGLGTLEFEAAIGVRK